MTFLAVWTIVLGAVYILRAVRNIFFGELSPSAAKVEDLTCCQRWPFVLLAASLLVIGFWPRLVIQFVQPVVNGWLGL